MDKNLPNRRTIRLRGYDYSQKGLYFVTICVEDKASLFGEIENDEMVLNEAGQMVKNEWNQLKDRFRCVELHDSIVMPNHFHGIIEIIGNENVGMPLVGIHDNGQPQGIAPTIGQIIGAFKSITTNRYIQGVKQHNWSCFHIKLWQRNYYEHIIRNEQVYNKIVEYILSNPYNWVSDDCYNN
ncbi:MAG: transposase [Dysgonomonas sp.]